MRNLRNLSFILVFILILCQSTVSFASLNKNLQKYGPDKYAIIYGRIDCRPVDADLLRVNLFRYPSKFAFKQNDSEKEDVNKGKGYFWAIVKPGQYAISDFRISGDKLTMIMFSYKNEDDIKSNLMLVNEGDMFYWGSAKYIRTRESGIFQSSQYALAAGNPSKRELLEEVLKHAKGTKWESIITEKLESIR
jgi:hypothetical protein